MPFPSPHSTMDARKALLVIDLQKEFLDPAVGRCLLPALPSVPGACPPFVAAVARLLPRFRDVGGDVIWVRSESKARRDFTDPRVEETIRIVNSDDEDSDSTASDDNTDDVPHDAPAEKPSSPAVRVRRSRSVKSGKLGGTGPSRPPLLTDAFLSVDTRFPPVAPKTPASEWHPAVPPLMTVPLDGTLTKSWYSAFKDTALIERLRSRYVTELYLCGLMTNISVLATAADAVRHGLEVWVVEDCLGYRSRTAHDMALDQMEDDFAVVVVTCDELISSLAGRTMDDKCAVFGDTGISKEDLTKMVEGLKLNPPEEPSRKEKDKERRRERARADAAEEGARKSTSDASLLSKNPPQKRVAKPINRTRQERTKAIDIALKAAQPEPADNQEKTATATSKVEEPLPEPEKPPEVASTEAAQPVLKNKVVRLPPESEIKCKEGSKEQTETAGEQEFDKPDPESKSDSEGKHSSDGKQTGKKPGMARKSPKKKKGKSKKALEKSPASPASDPPKLTTATASVEPEESTGLEDKLGEGDSYLVKSILPDELAETVFEALKAEVAWRTMFHRGGEVPRLVAVQGAIDEDGSFPIYRHPSDESPPLLQFSPTVSKIREHVEKVLQHPINHVLIQHYRHGNDYISEHSDKTLDIARGSKIVNVSVGAQRTMVLRTKRDALAHQGPTSEEEKAKRSVQRIPLPHNSMFVLGLETNAKWLHGIRQDKRDVRDKTAAELSHNGERISLTFRHIATSLTADEKHIFGQGAKAKTRDDAQLVINGASAETQALLYAFGSENQRSDFDWAASYGPGFNVLHMNTPTPKLLTSPAHTLECQRVRLCLLEKGIAFAEERLSPAQAAAGGLRAISPRGTTPVFVDTDRDRTTLTDSLAILQYLEMFLHKKSDGGDGDEEGQEREEDDGGPWLLPSPRDERSAYGLVCNRIQESQQLLTTLKRGDPADLALEMAVWETYLRPSDSSSDGFVVGDELTLADLAVYPVVREVLRADTEKRWPNVRAWAARMEARDSVKQVYAAAAAANT